MPKQLDHAPDLLLTEEPLSTDSPPSDIQHGASVQFLGIVRELEDGRKIDGIDYQCYPQMAEAKLAEIAEEGAAEFPAHRLKMHHRLGFVPAGITSVSICVTTPHSQAAFDLCRHYLHRLKTQLPIWKNVVFADPDS